MTPPVAVAVARWLGVPVPGARRVRCDDVVLGGHAPGRLWTPDRRGPGLVLAAGITPRGNDDPRLVRLADALARSGFVVFSPALALAERRLEPDDVELLVTSVLGLVAHPACAPGGVRMLGFSFGGSYALIAAGDPRLRGITASVGAFGAYAHLDGLVPAAREVETEEMRAYLDSPDAPELTDEERAALDRVLVDGAGPEALPESLARRLDALSPATAARPTAARTSLLHAVDDPVVPSAELNRLAASLPTAEVYRVHLFTHVDFRPTPRRLAEAARDLRTVHRFASAVLDP